MSDELASKSSELPELPDLPELPELPDLPDHSETKADESAPAPASKPVAPKPAPKPAAKQSAPKPAAPTAEKTPTPSGAQAAVGANAGAAGAADKTLAPGERPPLRNIEGAPTHLKKAAVIVTVGALLPFMNHGGGLMTTVGKVVVLAGLFLWYKQVEHNWGPKLTGFLGKMAELRLAGKKKEDDKKPARRSMLQKDAVSALEHPFPTGLHIGALVLIVVGCLVLPFLEPVGVNKGKAVAEVGMLAWAAATVVHIHAYERWGKFNPIFPLLFAGMAFAGIVSLIGGFSGVAEGFGKIGMIVGGALVGAGGGLAAFTIVEAMMQAKKEGDVKKQAQLEERRRARAARKSK